MRRVTRALFVILVSVALIVIPLFVEISPIARSSANIMEFLLQVMGVVAFALGVTLIYDIFMRSFRRHQFVMGDIVGASDLLTRPGCSVDLSRLAREGLKSELKELGQAVRRYDLGVYRPTYEAQDIYIREVERLAQERVTRPSTITATIDDFLPHVGQTRHSVSSTVTSRIVAYQPEAVLLPAGPAKGATDLAQAVVEISTDTAGWIVNLLNTLFPPDVTRITGRLQYWGGDVIGLTFSFIGGKAQSNIDSRTIWQPIPECASPSDAECASPAAYLTQAQLAEACISLLKPSIRWLVLTLWEQEAAARMPWKYRLTKIHLPWTRWTRRGKVSVAHASKGSPLQNEHPEEVIARVNEAIARAEDVALQPLTPHGTEAIARAEGVALQPWTRAKKGIEHVLAAAEENYRHYLADVNFFFGGLYYESAYELAACNDYFCRLAFERYLYAAEIDRDWCYPYSYLGQVLRHKAHGMFISGQSDAASVESRKQLQDEAIRLFDTGIEMAIQERERKDIVGSIQLRKARAKLEAGMAAGLPTGGEQSIREAWQIIANVTARDLRTYDQGPVPERPDVNPEDSARLLFNLACWYATIVKNCANRLAPEQCDAYKYLVYFYLAYGFVRNQDRQQWRSAMYDDDLRDVVQHDTLAALTRELEQTLKQVPSLPTQQGTAFAAPIAEALKRAGLGDVARKVTSI